MATYASFPVQHLAIPKQSGSGNCRLEIQAQTSLPVNLGSPSKNQKLCQNPLQPISPLRPQTPKPDPFFRPKKMKKALAQIIAFIGAIIILLFVANSIIRISDSSGKSWGIVEEKIFGKNIFSFLEPPWSDNYRRWEFASITSSETAELIQKHGHEIFTNPALEEMRIEAAGKLRAAYLAANAIDREYLEASHAELPVMYSEHFVEALSLWHEGFSSQNPEKFREGISSYNKFLLWIQGQERSDFKQLR